MAHARALTTLHVMIRKFMRAKSSLPRSGPLQQLHPAPNRYRVRDSHAGEGSHAFVETSTKNGKEPGYRARHEGEAHAFRRQHR